MSTDEFGQGHRPAPEALVPVLVEFLGQAK
jgi:hypothetical protein